MIKYAIKRLILGILSLLLIISFVYIIGHVINIQQWSSPHPVIEDLRVVIPSYFEYMKNLILHFDFGTNNRGVPVLPTLLDKIPYTVTINLIAFGIYVTLGVTFGIIAALNKNKIIDKVLNFFTIIFGSVPIFISVFFFILLWGYTLHWFPPQYTQPRLGWYGPISILVIPVISLSLTPISNIFRIIRAELIDSLEDDYVMLAKAKGLNKRQRLIRHSFRNSLLPLLPEISNTFIYTISTAFFVEIVYNIPGVANMLYKSLLQRNGFSNFVSIDVSLLVVTTVFYVSLGLLINFFVDILHGVVDPRVNITG